MTARSRLGAGMLAMAAWAGSATAQPPSPSPGRGQLLYETHCVACHDTQVHWRNRRRANDWPALLVQVRRWQNEARLNWDDADIEAVARHLNDTIYRHPRPVGALLPRIVADSVVWRLQLPPPSGARLRKLSPLPGRSWMMMQSPPL